MKINKRKYSKSSCEYGVNKIIIIIIIIIHLFHLCLVTLEYAGPGVRGIRDRELGFGALVFL
jgi:hypothetical protein